jgi:hypothetical protein
MLRRKPKQMGIAHSNGREQLRPQKAADREEKVIHDTLPKSNAVAWGRHSAAPVQRSICEISGSVTASRAP